MYIPDLQAAQNPDGGWSVGPGGACTEATALAALALAASDGSHESYGKAVRWLRALQRPDGGWPPMPQIAHSTWVTSLVLLIPPDHIGREEHRRGVEWLLRIRGEETSLATRMNQFLHGLPTPKEERHEGWPWIPGAAAWVSPTATAMLALRKAAHVPGVAERLEEGRQFLLDRRCADGGWNHGSVRALGIEAESYPETTGLALLALHGTPAAQLTRSYAAAAKHIENCRSNEGSVWLQLALLAHGMALPPTSPKACRDSRDASLHLLAEAAKKGRSVFL